MFVKRFAARVIDGFFSLFAVAAATAILLGVAVVAGALPDAVGWLLLVLVTLTVVSVVLVALWVNSVDLPAVQGQSIGKKQLGVGIDFSEARFASAHTASFVRELIYGLLGPLVLLGLLFTSGERGLHDIAAGTRVVSRSK